MPPDMPEDLRRLSSLEDDTRRGLYEHVVAAGRPVTRDEASRAVGVDRSLAAYHLDKLVDEGLLVASFARPEGRGGPGAGRPSKRYERAAGEFAVTVPARDYELVAELLAQAAEADPSGEFRQAVERVAASRGRELAEGERADLLAVLRRHGFEPFDDDGVIRLRNCPFHRIAAAHTELVCGMNLAMLSGVVDALGGAGRPRLDPGPDRCCVAIDPA